MSRLVALVQRGGEAALIPLGALAVSALLFGVFVALAGAPPLEVFYSIYQGGFGTWFSWQNSLLRAAPLMLAALCTVLPARAGLLIIGGDGALIVGGLAAAGAAMAFGGAPSLVVQFAMLAAAVLAGGAWIAGAGAMRYYRGVNETISSLLLAYVAIALLNHFITGPMRDPASLNKPATPHIGDANMLGSMPGLDVHWGLAFGVVACVIAYVVYRHTVFGFSASVVAGNPGTARSIGLPSARILLMSCFLGGAAAGVAGMVEVAAVHGRANDSLDAGYGFTGILVAFLARQNPLAVIPVAILIGGIAASGGLLQRRFDLPDATVLVFQGIVFVVILLSESMRGRIRWFQSREGAL